MLTADSLVVQFYRTHDPDKIKYVDIFLAEFSADRLLAHLMEKYGETPEAVTTFYKKGKLVLADEAYATREEYITHSDLESFYKKHDPKKVSRVDDQLSHSNPKALIRRLVLRYGSGPPLTKRHDHSLVLLLSGDYKKPDNAPKVGSTEQQLDEHIRRQNEQKAADERRAEAAQIKERDEKHQKAQQERDQAAAQEEKRRKRVEQRQQQQRTAGDAAATSDLKASAQKTMATTGVSPMVLAGIAVVAIVFIVLILKAIVPGNQYSHKKSDGTPMKGFSSSPPTSPRAGSRSRQAVLNEMC